MFKAKLIASLAKFGAGAKAFAILHAPAALMGVGAALVVWAIVETAKAASKPNDEIEQAVGDLEEASEKLKECSEEERPKLKKEKRSAFRKIVKEFIKQYKKPIIMATIGLSAMVGGYLWVAKRFAIAAAEAATASAALATLDNNVRKTFGDDIANAMHSKDFDPDMLETHYTPGAIERAREAGTLSTDMHTAGDYARKVIGPDDIPSQNLYHFNEMTVDRNCWTSDWVRNMKHLELRIKNLQRNLDSVPEVIFITRRELLKDIGLSAAMWHGSTMQGRVDRSQDGELCWCKGDTIDIGLTDLFEEIHDHADDAEYMAFLAEKNKDTILHLNCTLEAYDRATLLAGTGAPIFFDSPTKRYKDRMSLAMIPEKIWDGMFRNKERTTEYAPEC